MLSSPRQLVLGAQAAGAQVEAHRLTIFYYSYRVNIGHPAPVGMALGVAYIMTELGRFTA